MNKDLMLFAKKLKQIRKQRHLTLEKFSELVDISPNHISKLESARTFPSFQLISRIANALNIDIKELFDFDGDKDEEYLRDVDFKVGVKVIDSLMFLYTLNKEKAYKVVLLPKYKIVGEFFSQGHGKNEFVQMIKHSDPKYLNTLYKIHQNLTEL